MSYLVALLEYANQDIKIFTSLQFAKKTMCSNVVSDGCMFMRKGTSV
jgi:hypothetical protein